MKFLVVLAVAVACASADVSHVVKDEASAPIVKSGYDIGPDGAFQYEYETGNGIAGTATGTLTNVNSEVPALTIAGANKYVSPEGITIETTYTADENGYHPQGAHLPVGPPTPEAILRAIQYIASHSPPVVEKVGPTRFARRV